MKNVCLSSMLIVLMCLPATVWANVNPFPTQTDSSLQTLFQLDEVDLYQSVDQLSQLEAYVKANPGVSLEQLQAEAHPLIADLQLSQDASISATEPPLGVPSFLWGFCLGIIGLAIVYFVTEDREQTEKALIGCLIGGLIGTIINVAFTLNQ
ncbi:MAG: hypothetical protein AAGM67_17900 [Bacteroidota bacterium]